MKNVQYLFTDRDADCCIVEYHTGTFVPQYSTRHLPTCGLLSDQRFILNQDFILNTYPLDVIYLPPCEVVNR